MQVCERREREIEDHGGEIQTARSPEDVSVSSVKISSANVAHKEILHFWEVERHCSNALFHHWLNTSQESVWSQLKSQADNMHKSYCY